MPSGGPGTSSPARVLILLAAAGALVAVYVVRWIVESPAEIAQSDFVPLQVAGVIVRGGQGAQLYDPVLQARVYAAVTHAAHPGTLFYIHAPLAAVLMVPISLAELGVAFHLMGAVQLACLAAAAVIAARALPDRRTRGRGARRRRGLALPSTLLMLREGQDVGIAALLVATSYMAMRRDRPALAGALLGVAALAGKPHLFLGVAVWVVFLGNRRLLAGAVAGTLLGALASFAVVGTGGFSGFVAALASGRSDFPNAQESMSGLFSAWLGDGVAATLLAVLTTVAALGCVAIAARRAARNRLTLESSLGIAVILSLLAAPHLYPHDLALLTPVFAWTAVGIGAAATSSAAAVRGAGRPGWRCWSCGWC